VIQAEKSATQVALEAGGWPWSGLALSVTCSWVNGLVEKAWGGIGRQRSSCAASWRRRLCRAQKQVPPSPSPFADWRKNPQPALSPRTRPGKPRPVGPAAAGPLANANSTEPNGLGPCSRSYATAAIRFSRALATRLLEIAVLPGGQAIPAIQLPADRCCRAELPGPLGQPRPAAPIPQAEGRAVASNWPGSPRSALPCWRCVLIARVRLFAGAAKNPTHCPLARPPSSRVIDVILLIRPGGFVLLGRPGHPTADQFP